MRAKSAHPPLRFLRHKETGIVRVKIRTPRGSQWISTGQVSFERAREVCTLAAVQEMQVAANADALREDVLCRLTHGRRFTCSDILGGWREETAESLSPGTFHSYSCTLATWLEFCECANLPLSSVGRRELSAFINEPSIAFGSRKGRHAALRSFYRYASVAGYCVGNMAERVFVKTRDLVMSDRTTKNVMPITEDEFRVLMSSPKVKGFYRWATALGYWLGYRLADIACFEIASLSENVSTIYQRKTGARVTLPLDDPLLGGGELHRILLEIVEQVPPGAVYCFPDKREIAVNPKRRANLSVGFGRILERHGIRGKHFHCLRHAFKLRLANAGRSIEEIARYMGHASTKTTEGYGVGGETEETKT